MRTLKRRLYAPLPIHRVQTVRACKEHGVTLAHAELFYVRAPVTYRRAVRWLCVWCGADTSMPPWVTADEEAVEGRSRDTSKR